MRLTDCWRHDHGRYLSFLWNINIRVTTATSKVSSLLFRIVGLEVLLLRKFLNTRENWPTAAFFWKLLLQPPFGEMLVSINRGWMHSICYQLLLWLTPTVAKRGLLHTWGTAGVFPLSFGAGTNRVGVGRLAAGEVVAGGEEIIEGATFNFFACFAFCSEGAGFRCNFLFWTSISRDINATTLFWWVTRPGRDGSTVLLWLGH